MESFQQMFTSMQQRRSRITKTTGAAILLVFTKRLKPAIGTFHRVQVKDHFLLCRFLVSKEHRSFEGFSCGECCCELLSAELQETEIVKKKIKLVFVALKHSISSVFRFQCCNFYLLIPLRDDFANVVLGENFTQLNLLTLSLTIFVAHGT